VEIVVHAGLGKEVRVQFHELTPIANLLVEPAVIVVKGDSPYRTLGDFIEAAKKTPDKLLQVGSSIESHANLLRLRGVRDQDPALTTTNAAPALAEFPAPKRKRGAVLIRARGP
jgi:tripartite-type tricarboxylate transporter receptor subunit TctC